MSKKILLNDEDRSFILNSYTLFSSPGILMFSKEKSQRKYIKFLELYSAYVKPINFLIINQHDLKENVYHILAWHRWKFDMPAIKRKMLDVFL